MIYVLRYRHALYRYIFYILYTARKLLTAVLGPSHRPFYDCFMHALPAYRHVPGKSCSRNPVKIVANSPSLLTIHIVVPRGAVVRR